MKVKQNPMRYKLSYQTVLFGSLIALAACASQEEKAATAAARGLEASQAGDHIQARNSFLEAVGHRDDIAEYWLLLARANMALQEYGAAHGAYSRALELSRSSIEALQGLGQLSLASGRHEDASKYADQIILLDPDNAAAALLHGFVHLKKQNYAEARFMADGVLARFPSEEAALILKANAMFGSGARKEAAALLEQELRVSGTSRAKLNALQEFYRESGDLSASKRTLQRIAELDPGGKEAQLQYARFLFANGFAGEGVAFIRASLKSPFASELVETMRRARRADLRPGMFSELAGASSAAVAVDIAAVAVDHGYANEAARILKPLVLPLPKAYNPTAIALYGSVQELLGEVNDASRLAEFALDQDPTNPRALKLRATLALKKGSYDQALADVQLLVRDYPRDIQHRLMLARVYEARNDKALAGLVYRKAFADFPDSSAARTAYAAHLRTTGKSSEADRINRMRRAPAATGENI